MTNKLRIGGELYLRVDYYAQMLGISTKRIHNMLSRAKASVKKGKKLSTNQKLLFENSKKRGNRLFIKESVTGAIKWRI